MKRTAHHWQQTATVTVLANFRWLAYMSYQRSLAAWVWFQHEEEPPQDLRPGAAGEKSLSKAALKNQKKREAKKAARQVSGRQRANQRASCTSLK